jgi:hypothetical protein
MNRKLKKVLSKFGNQSEFGCKVNYFFPYILFKRQKYLFRRQNIFIDRQMNAVWKINKISGN